MAGTSWNPRYQHQWKWPKEDWGYRNGKDWSRANIEKHATRHSWNRIFADDSELTYKMRQQVRAMIREKVQEELRAFLGSSKIKKRDGKLPRGTMRLTPRSKPLAKIKKRRATRCESTTVQEVNPGQESAASDMTSEQTRNLDAALEAYFEEGRESCTERDANMR